VLVDKPDYLFGMLDEIRRELCGEHEVNRVMRRFFYIEQPPGEGCAQDIFFRIPLKGDHHRIDNMPLLFQLRRKGVNEFLRASADERHLRATDEYFFVSSRCHIGKLSQHNTKVKTYASEKQVPKPYAAPVIMQR